MNVLSIKHAFKYFLLTIQRVKVYAQPPWGQQCRKFDFYFAIYPAPIDTISMGLTIPFLFCLYISLGSRFNWWGTSLSPLFPSATVGIWLFLGTRMCSWNIKTTKRCIEGVINF